MGGDSSFRLVIRSLGSASPRVRRTLSTSLGLGDARVAEVLFRAPQELVGGLPRAIAESAKALLESTGLDVEVLGEDDAFTPGVGDLEVALSIQDEARVPDIIASVADLLDLPPERAMDVVWRSPCQLLGGISQSTADALRRRFSPLGAELDVSRPEAALFDVFVGACAEGVRAAAASALARAGAVVEGDKPMLALGLTKAQADAVWESLRRYSAPVRVLNRDFQRFDVCLEHAPDSPEMRALLASAAGMPERVVPKVLQRLPVVVLSQAQHSVAYGFLAEAARLGARATAELLALQTFSIVVEGAPDLRAAEAFVRSLGRSAPPAGNTSSFPWRLPGPFSPVQARWAAFRLRELGASVRTVRL
jgi:ribosomal protein L7/L12